MNNFFTRALAGAVYVALIVGSLMLGNVSFGLLCLIILIFALDEYFSLIKKLKYSNPSLAASLGAIAIFILVILYKNGIVEVRYLYLAPLTFLLFMVGEMFSTNRNAVGNVALTAFGYIYILFPIISLYLIGFNDKYAFTENFNSNLVIGFFVLNWTSDTGAYLAGKSFGKNKLFERISPKKTIEGSVGGLILTLAVAWVLSMYITTLSTLDWMIMAILIVTFGILGDLFESLLKRKAEVKDSGKIIPGHGGMLDRFDSVLFSAPVVFIFLNLIGA